jgi:hypothetical protein
MLRTVISAQCSRSPMTRRDPFLFFRAMDHRPLVALNDTRQRPIREHRSRKSGRRSAVSPKTLLGAWTKTVTFSVVVSLNERKAQIKLRAAFWALALTAPSVVPLSLLR